MGRSVDRTSSDSIANGLDTGKTDQVINALQQDFYKMCPEDFKRIVTAAAAKEDPRFGDNLKVERNGDIILNFGDNGQSSRIGNLREQEIAWRQTHGRNDGRYNDQIPGRPVVREGDHGRYYEGRQVYQDNRYDRYDRNDRNDRYDPQYGNRGYEPRYDNRGYDPRNDPRGYDNRGYDNRGGINGGQVIIDFLRGGASSYVGGGKFIPGGATNAGIGVLLNSIGGRRNGW